MKQLLVGLVATFAFGTAFAQSAAPAAAAVAAPAAQEQGQDQTVAPAEGVFSNTAQVPTTPVVNTAPKVSKAVISASVAAGIVAIALLTGGGSDDSDDRPSSP